MASKEVSWLPTYRELPCRMLEVLKSMAMPATNAEIDSAIADALGLSEEQRNALHTRGNQTKLAYRCGWARTDLRRIRALEKAGRALWNLTNTGRGMNCAEVQRALDENKKNRRKSKADDLDQHISDKDDYTQSEDWRQTLLNALLAMPSSGFERLVGKLLESAGFDEVQVMGNAADGGIDAVGVHRPFGLIAIRTSVQCRRWRGSVGREQIEAFQRENRHQSDRGIMITTGAFTDEARVQAQGVFPVDLIDGAQLAELFKERELGVRVTRRTVEEVSIDESYLA